MSSVLEIFFTFSVQLTVGVNITGTKLEQLSGFDLVTSGDLFAENNALGYFSIIFFTKYSNALSSAKRSPEVTLESATLWKLGLATKV